LYFVNLADASPWLRRSWSPNYSVLVFLEKISCCLQKQKQSAVNYYTKQNPIHNAFQPLKNIWFRSYKQKVSRGSEIITNFGTQCIFLLNQLVLSVLWLHMVANGMTTAQAANVSF
jgi:hypothetical protein